MRVKHFAIEVVAMPADRRTMSAHDAKTRVTRSRSSAPFGSEAKLTKMVI
jgi:hypothetical protein